ncbi:MAG: uracil phosphoribosyltransferase [Pirellulales bacterium]|nr:uracil phosphoribosyltransferase [Pirellulales bacterium]
MNVQEVHHPLIQHHLTRLRHQTTAPIEFRNLIRRVAVLLAYEATKDLQTQPREVETPLVVTEGSALKQSVGLVPILRAGLGMVDAVLDLIPQAEVWHLGLYRDEKTARPIEYYKKLPQSEPVDVALVLDPMLATGGSATAAVSTLRAWGVPKIKLLTVIASRDGIEEVHRQDSEVQIFVTAIDPELNDDKFIIPGLGDAGDRIFNTFKQRD